MGIPFLHGISHDITLCVVFSGSQIKFEPQRAPKLPTRHPRSASGVLGPRKDWGTNQTPHFCRKWKIWASPELLQKPDHSPCTDSNDAKIPMTGPAFRLRALASGLRSAPGDSVACLEPSLSAAGATLGARKRAPRHGWDSDEVRSCFWSNGVPIARGGSFTKADFDQGPWQGVFGNTWSCQLPALAAKFMQSCPRVQPKDITIPTRKYL